jgi:ornithine decarboxylase
VSASLLLSVPPKRPAQRSCMARCPGWAGGQRWGLVRMRHRVRAWLLRYAPAELAATLGALLAAAVGARLAGPVGAAVAGTLGETVAFYGFVVVRELRAERRSSAARSSSRALSDLLLEFGPAEVLDTLAVRPLAMYVGPLLIGNLAVGIMVGKVAADLVFYTLAAIGYELRRPRPLAGDPLASAALDARTHRTPYLLMDLDRVTQAYHRLAAALPVDAIHYAVKCNPHPLVLTALHRAGCRFEVASFPELATLRKIGVRPADVLFSNPVKPPHHIARAHRAGCWRYAADSSAELHKLAAHAPGAAVYVRLRPCTPATSIVASEGKFGVDPTQAYELLLTARVLGLQPYGLTFHVGSQMTQPGAWQKALDQVGALATRLAIAGIHLEMIDIGGGFPACYGHPVPSLDAYGEQIGRALDRLPYRPHIVAEPGRAIVAEAGVMVSTVIGTARRADRDWAHLDVGAFNGLMEALETGNTLNYPVSDSRRSNRQPWHLTGPTCDSQDTILLDTALSADLACGDRVYIGSTGAYTTAYAAPFNGFDIPAVLCVADPAHTRDIDHPPTNTARPPAIRAASALSSDTTPRQ